MMNSRQTILDLSYNKSNVTALLGEHLKSWTFTDNLSGQIDDIQIVLEDTDHLWLSDWFPSKGSLLKAFITKKYWTDKVIKTNIGKFEVDEIEGDGPPTGMTIKALSVPESSSLRGEDKSRVWEKTTLKVVAGDIAKRNNLKLYFQTSENPKKDRYEQQNQTDLAFLYQLCREEGLCLKLSNSSIVILDEADYEASAAVATINRVSNVDDEIQVENWSFKTTLSGTYKACRVEYTNPKTKKTIKATFTPPKAPKVGRILVINEEVNSVAEAQKLAKKKLRETNKEATTIQLNVTSEKHLDAGMTVNLKGFGKLDGKYIITQVRHSQESVSLQLRKCLEGY